MRTNIGTQNLAYQVTCISVTCKQVKCINLFTQAYVHHRSMTNTLSGMQPIHPQGWHIHIWLPLRYFTVYIYNNYRPIIIVHQMYEYNIVSHIVEVWFECMVSCLTTL